MSTEPSKFLQNITWLIHIRLYYECEAHSHLPCEWEAHSHLGYHCEACANSGYQALFSNFLTGVGNEASLFAWTNHLSQILKKCIQIFHKD